MEAQTPCAYPAIPCRFKGVSEEPMSPPTPSKVHTTPHLTAYARSAESTRRICISMPVPHLWCPSPHQHRLPPPVCTALAPLLYPCRAPFTSPPISQGTPSASKAGRFPVSSQGSRFACTHAAFPRPLAAAFCNGSAQETAASSPDHPPGRVLQRPAARASN